MMGHLRYKCHLLPRPPGNYHKAFTGESLGEAPGDNSRERNLSEPGLGLGNPRPVGEYSRQPPMVQLNRTADFTNRRSGQLLTRDGRSGEAAATEIKSYFSAMDGMVVEVGNALGDWEPTAINSKYVKILEPLEIGEQVTGAGNKLQESMAGERARLRSEVEDSSSPTDKGPPKPRTRVSFEQADRSEDSNA